MPPGNVADPPPHAAAELVESRQFILFDASFLNADLQHPAYELNSLDEGFEVFVVARMRVAEPVTGRFRKGMEIDIRSAKWMSALQANITAAISGACFEDQPGQRPPWRSRKIASRGKPKDRLRRRPADVIPRVAGQRQDDEVRVGASASLTA